MQDMIDNITCALAKQKCQFVIFGLYEEHLLWDLTF